MGQENGKTNHRLEENTIVPRPLPIPETTDSTKHYTEGS